MMTWQEKVQTNAMTFASNVEREFDKAIAASVTHLPENNGANRAQILNDHLDCLIGLTVQIASKYTSTTKELEETVVESIRYKFEHLRAPKTALIQL